METQVFRDIVARLPRGRTLFWYERDRYAVQLVDYLLRAGWSARDIKASAFGRLLEKDALRAAMAARGVLALDRSDLDLIGYRAPLPFRLTVDQWGWQDDEREQQNTRKGVTLVLQLNMANDHTQALKARFRFDDARLFNGRSHPVARNEHTLAWARIDIDPQSGEALIEEVQSDWVRYARRAATNPTRFFRARLARHIEEPKRRAHYFRRGAKDYVRVELPPYAVIWEEAMLSAALFFLVEEIGIRRIFMHQYESGNRLKEIDGNRLPPRSIYTDLPRKFCFQLGAEQPDFVRRMFEKKTKVRRPPRYEDPYLPPVRFWRIDLNERKLACRKAA